MASKSTPTAEQVSAAFRLIADAIDAGVFTSGGSTSSDAGDQYDRDEVEGLPIGDLRGLAKELGLDEQKVKNKILDEMEAKGLFADSEGEDDEEDEEEFEEDEDEEADDEEEDDEDEEEEGEEDAEGFDREELEEMSLAELKSLAKKEGHPASVYRKMDQEELVDLLAGSDAEDEEDEDEEEEEIDEDTLKAMDLGQLKKVASELNLKPSTVVAKSKIKLVNFILENAGEEDDE